MAQMILGVDLGAHAVKAVLLESAYRGYVVAGAARAPVPAGEEPLAIRQASALGALLAERGWRADSTIVAYPGASLSSNVVTLPFTDTRRIEQTVGFEIEGQIPFELDEVAWDWQPLAAHDGKTDLYVAVVRKEELAALLSALAGAGVDPRAVVPAAPAYAALASAGVLAGAPAVVAGAPVPAEVIVDVGHERTSVCVVSAGAAEAARTFAFGAAHLVRALARDLAVSDADAGALLAAPGPDVDPRVAEPLRRALVPLAREVRATLRAWHARAGQRPVARLVLAGEAARNPAVADALAPEVEAPISPLLLAPPAADRVDAAEASGYALALALALRGHHGARAPRLNLRRGALAFTRDFEHVKGRVARLGAYAALLVLLAIVSAGVKVFALSRQEAALDRALCDAEQKIIGRCYDNFEEAQSILRGRGTPGAALPRVTAVDLFAELSERVPADVNVRFDRIELTKEKLHLQGTTDAAEHVDRIVSALKSSRCFGDARSGGARRRAGDGRFEFSVDSALTCLESGREAPGGKG